MYLRIHTDGGSRGNPGPAAAGIVISDQRGNTLFARGYFLGNATNNVAEYEGVLHALTEAARLGGTELEICCDSELLVKQINGQYRVKNDKLRPLHRQISQRLAEFDKTTIRHVRRENNMDADSLVNAALDAESDVDDLPMQDSRDTARSSFFTLRDLDRLITAAVDRPHRGKISEQGNLQNGLICLNPGQSYDMKTDWTEATITVLQGKGVLKTPDKERTLTPHTWIHLSQTASVAMYADTTEPLAVLVTLV